MNVPREEMDEELAPAGEEAEMEAAVEGEEEALEGEGEEGGEFIPADGQPRPRGTPDDIAREQQDADPWNAEAVTEDEQAQYEDFVARAILMISDTRKPEEGALSPSEATMKIMNNRKLTVPQAIGLAAARVTLLIHNNAKRQEVTYSPDVLFHGADELIPALYVMGNVAGIFDGVQPIKVPEGGDFEGYEFSEQEMKLLEEAKLHAVHEFGLMLEQTGQISEEQMEEAQQFWKSQIEREMNAGEVGDDILSEIDIDSARAEMGKKLEGRRDGT